MGAKKTASNLLRRVLLGSGVTIGNIRHGSYSTAALQKRLFDQFQFDCVLDVGANRGQYVRELRDIVGYRGRVISFEPIPALAAALREISKDDPLWHVEEVALSNVAGTDSFNIMANDLYSSLSDPFDGDTQAYEASNKVVKRIEVQTQRLDAILPAMMETYGVKRPYLKLDTQGYDLIVLEGAKGVLPAIQALQSEVSVKRLYETSQGLAETLDCLRGLGFVLCGFSPVSYRPFPEATELDGFFVRPCAEESASQSAKGAPVTA